MNEEKIEMMKVEDLVPYANNPRNNDAAVEPVSASIQKFKFRNPILIDDNNVVIAGHTRLLASKKLGIVEVPCIRISDLTENQIKALRIADNKAGEYSYWDEDSLAMELQELDQAGFSGMDELMKKLAEPVQYDNFSQSFFGNCGMADHYETKDSIDRNLWYGKPGGDGYFGFGLKEIRLSDEEKDRLNKMYENYMDKNKNAYGMGIELLDNGDSNYAC